MDDKTKQKFNDDICDNVNDWPWVYVQDDFSIGLDGYFTVEELEMIAEKLKGLRNCSSGDVECE
jgi:hypothetical protein